MNGRNSTWFTPSTSIFIVIWLMKPDHSETLRHRVAVDLKRSHMDAMFSLPVMMLKLFIDFSKTEIFDLSILPLYFIGMAIFRRSSLVGYFFKIDLCCIEPCLTTLRIIHIMWRVFLPSRVAWRNLHYQLNRDEGPITHWNLQCLVRNHESTKIFQVRVPFQCRSQSPYYAIVIQRIHNHHFCDTSQQQMPGAKDKIWYLVLQAWLVLCR